MSTAVFSPKIQVFKSNEDLFAGASELLLSILLSDAAKAGRTTLALAGGSTPKGLYQLWAADDAIVEKLNKAVDFYFGDVRMVPDDHPDSNFKMAYESLLHKIQPGAVFPCETTLPAAECAKKYADLLHQRVDPDQVMPSLDVVLLGFGPDGHTASIFPGTDVAKNRTDIVATCMPGPDVSPQVERTTLTPAAISAAKNVVVMATGASKKWVLEGLLCSDEEAEAGKKKLPVSRWIRECKGNVFLLVDEAAAPL